MMECARDPCFYALVINGKEIGRCMKEKGHNGVHQCMVQWKNLINL